MNILIIVTILIIVSPTINRYNTYFNASRGRQFIQFSRQLFATIFLESIDESVILARFVRRLYNVVGVCRRPNQVQGDLDNENTSRVLPENISHAAFKRNLP